MSGLLQRFPPVLLIVGLLLSGCNLPSNVAAPEVSSEDIASTAVAEVFTQQAAAAAPSATFTATAVQAPVAQAGQCNPTVTATTDANVRAGDSTEYAVIGNLPNGGTAVVAGTNAAHTWWYIVFAGGPGGYGWISGSIVTTACLPAVVQVVVAPPLPQQPQDASPTPVPGGQLLFPFPLFLLPSATPTPFILFNPDLIPLIPLQPINP
jgi:hypothetical protein